MTDFRTLAADRYTTKKYDPTKQISAELVAELKEILRLSPSSINSQPWRFTFVSDPKLKEELAPCSFHNEEKVKDASHLVVFSVIDNIDLFEKQINENLPEGAVGYYNKNIKPGTEAEIKAWMAHQVYLSLGFFLSGAASLGVDSTPMEGINTAEYDRILNIEGYRTLFAVALGYRDPDDFNQPSLKPKSRIDLNKVIYSI
ncbi:NAD(P)H-dependent oxidoreductase [Mangrovibacterium lignilyticum]|uniref:NAD(P)H-dependent oxidoreductase n=1 Tax=Mangrovibacterium lignilyticum TaxID=2668052 RepID=UPI0013D5374D|nr:NAD(P)H-dependent oxidoreductase [Mangrovibacterium lignilyticum]